MRTGQDLRLHWGLSLILSGKASRPHSRESGAGGCRQTPATAGRRAPLTLLGKSAAGWLGSGRRSRLGSASSVLGTFLAFTRSFLGEEGVF